MREREELLANERVPPFRKAIIILKVIIILSISTVRKILWSFDLLVWDGEMWERNKPLHRLFSRECFTASVQLCDGLDVLLASFHCLPLIECQWLRCRDFFEKIFFWFSFSSSWFIKKITISKKSFISDKFLNMSFRHFFTLDYPSFHPCLLHP